MTKKIYLLLLLPVILLAQNPVTWTKHVVSDTLEKAKKNVVLDVDLDGDLDIVCNANPEGAGSEDLSKANVLLFLNDGIQNFTESIISYRFRGARALAAGDLTGDGYPEVVVGNNYADSSLVWFINPASGYNSIWAKHTLGGFAPLNYIALVFDLDQDGDMDIVDGQGDAANGGTSAGDYIRWFENDGLSSPTFTERDIINYPSPSGIAVADFDADSDNDISGACWLNYTSVTPITDEDVRWWSQGTSAWTQEEVIKTSYGGNDLYAADMDGDGDQDIIGAGWKAQTIDWWANDGTGNFGASLYTVATAISYPRSVAAADMDGDDDMDLLACADNDNTVFWFENDGSMNFTQHNLSTAFTYAYFASAADMDGDGDLDVVATAQDKIETGGTVAGQAAWWESDLAEEKIIASGDPAAQSYNNFKLIIDFASGYTGGMTSVFYNHGANSHRQNVNSALHHIAAKGYYTIVSHASTYSATIDFYYAGIAEWSAISNESDLRVCYWDVDSGISGEWVILNSAGQTVFAADDYIRVTGINLELHTYSLFTLGSVSSDNALPVQLLSFKAEQYRDGVELIWQTSSELNNRGFEIRRKTDRETKEELIASYVSDPALEGLGTSSAGREYRYFDSQVLPGKSYTYILYDVSVNGQRSAARNLSVDFIPGGVTRVHDGFVATTPQLKANYPNPFNQSTVVSFYLPQTKDGTAIPVTLNIYDAQGGMVRTLFNGSLSAGTYRMFWDGKNSAGQTVASGMYFSRLAGPDFALNRRMTLVK